MISPYRSLFIDMNEGDDGPKRRDCIASITKRGIGSIYLVLKSHKVKRHDPKALARYTMLVKRIDEIPEGSRVIGLRWYPRKRKCLTFEQYMRRIVDCPNG